MTSKLPLISGRDCVRAMLKVGFNVERQRGSHIIMRKIIPPPSLTIVVPDHAELDRGTLRSIIRQANMDIDSFLALLD